MKVYHIKTRVDRFISSSLLYNENLKYLYNIIDFILTTTLN